MQNAKKTVTKPDSDQKEYTLKKRHKDRGVELNPGDKITLNDQQAAWLKSEDVI